MDQIAKRLAPDDLFGDSDPLALDGCGFDVERRLFVAAGCPLQQLRGSRGIPAKIRVRKRIERIAKNKPGRIRRRSRRGHGGMAQLIKVIEHVISFSE